MGKQHLSRDDRLIMKGKMQGTRVLVDVMVDTKVSEPKHHRILLGQVEINLSGSRVAAALGRWCGGGEGMDGTHRGVTHGRPVHRVTPDPSVLRSVGSSQKSMVLQPYIQNIRRSNQCNGHG